MGGKRDEFIHDIKRVLQAAYNAMSVGIWIYPMSAESATTRRENGNEQKRDGKMGMSKRETEIREIIKHIVEDDLGYTFQTVTKIEIVPQKLLITYYSDYPDRSTQTTKTLGWF